MHVLRRPPGAGGGKSGALNHAPSGPRRGPRRLRRRPQPEPGRAAPPGAALRRPRVDAVQGRCIIRNSVESTLARSIAIDYFSGYLVNEYGRQALFELPAYGGANCAVRASRCAQLGGWNEETRHRGHRPHPAARARRPAGPVRHHRDRHRGERSSRCAASGASATAGPAATSRSGASTARPWCARRTCRSRADRDADVPARLPRPGVCALGAADHRAAHRRRRPSVSVFEMLPLAALLFAGPFCELAVGLVVGRAPRRAAWSVAWLPRCSSCSCWSAPRRGSTGAGPALHLGEDQADGVLVAA